MCGNLHIPVIESTTNNHATSGAVETCWWLNEIQLTKIFIKELRNIPKCILILILPVTSLKCCHYANTYPHVVWLMLILPGTLLASRTDAMVTVDPKRQYLGIFWPTIPATHSPEWIPVRIWEEKRKEVKNIKCFFMNVTLMCQQTRSDCMIESNCMHPCHSCYLVFFPNLYDVKLKSVLL